MPSSDTLQDKIDQLRAEVEQKQAQLNALMQEVPNTVVPNYAFHDPNGNVHLSELFGDKQDLIVIHNMGVKCSYCTLWADGLNGMVPHFESRAAVVVVSSDTPQVQQAFAEQRGWKLRMISDQGPFTTEMGYVKVEDGKKVRWPGFSTFKKEEDGTISRVAHAFFGPGDPYCGIWHMFALLDNGLEGWRPKLAYDV